MHCLPGFFRTELFKLPRYSNGSLRSCEPGGLVVLDCPNNHPGFPEFIEHLAACGYKPRRRHADCDFTITNGSIEYHDDSGFGLVAICLAHVEDPDPASHSYNYDAQLITRSGAASMNVGNVVVFNSNAKHAWLSGFPCILASVSVSKLRTRST